MRMAEIRGFTFYDLYDGLVLQRGHLERLSKERIVEAFEKYNIQIVIGLAKEESLTLRSLHEDGFIDYFHHKIPDNCLSDADAEWLLDTASDLAPDVSGGVSVLSYCNAGRNRSGLMNALLLREILEISGEEAMEIVRRERPNAIANPHFEDFLRSLYG